MQLQLSEERQAQLNEYAQRYGLEPSVATDEFLAAHFDWEQQDFNEAVEGIRRGYEDMKAGRTRPASEMLKKLREKHGFNLLTS